MKTGNTGVRIVLEVKRLRNPC